MESLSWFSEDGVMRSSFVTIWKKDMRLRNFGNGQMLGGIPDDVDALCGEVEFVDDISTYGSLNGLPLYDSHDDTKKQIGSVCDSYVNESTIDVRISISDPEWLQRIADGEIMTRKSLSIEGNINVLEEGGLYTLELLRMTGVAMVSTPSLAIAKVLAGSNEPVEEIKVENTQTEIKTQEENSMNENSPTFDEVKSTEVKPEMDVAKIVKDTVDQTLAQVKAGADEEAKNAMDAQSAAKKALEDSANDAENAIGTINAGSSSAPNKIPKYTEGEQSTISVASIVSGIDRVYLTDEIEIDH